MEYMIEKWTSDGDDNTKILDPPLAYLAPGTICFCLSSSEYFLDIFLHPI